MYVRGPYPAISPDDVRPWLEIRRTLQGRLNKQRCRVELVGLLLCLAAGLGAALWAGPRVSVEIQRATMGKQVERPQVGVLEAELALQVTSCSPSQM
jgi:hypothetical protein